MVIRDPYPLTHRGKGWIAVLHRQRLCSPTQADTLSDLAKHRYVDAHSDPNNASAQTRHLENTAALGHMMHHLSGGWITLTAADTN